MKVSEVIHEIYNDMEPDDVCVGTNTYQPDKSKETLRSYLFEMAHRNQIRKELAKEPPQLMFKR